MILGTWRRRSPIPRPGAGHPARLLLIAAVAYSTDCDKASPNQTDAELRRGGLRETTISSLARRELLPAPVETEDEQHQKIVDAREAAFHRAWTEGGAECVVDGTIDSATAELIPNNTGLLSAKPWFIVTRYLVAVTQIWGGCANTKAEFFVLGGEMPPGTPVPQNGEYPLGMKFSFEVYPSVGDRVLVALKLRSLPSRGTARRPVFDEDSILIVNGSHTIPSSVTARIKERLNAAFGN